jgi:ectoine hydroxylase-related dioxygenase (phytanoyl-CoA dioxygenase family)
MYDVGSFEQNGFAGPYKLTSRERMLKIGEVLAATTFHDTNVRSGNPLLNRYLDNRLVYQLCSQPVMIEAIRRVLGDDLLLWTSAFIPKAAHGPEIPWHQDAHYWPLEPRIVVTAWLAVTDVTPRNGCLQVLPGTHRDLQPFVPATHACGLDKLTDVSRYDVGSAVTLEMQAGEFVLFNEQTVHRSFQNDTDQIRMGMVARFTTCAVKLNQDRFPFFKGHGAILVSGSDRFGHNVLADPPSGEDIDLCQEDLPQAKRIN